MGQDKHGLEIYVKGLEIFPCHNAASGEKRCPQDQLLKAAQEQPKPAHRKPLQIVLSNSRHKASRLLRKYLSRPPNPRLLAPDWDKMSIEKCKKHKFSPCFSLCVIF
jgi:hypothetical protein